MFRWNELRGDEFDDWGHATYYFEVDADGTVVKQMELYTNGVALHYDENHRYDGYGSLNDRLFDPFATSEIPKTEFYLVWNAYKPYNR